MVFDRNRCQMIPIAERETVVHHKFQIYLNFFFLIQFKKMQNNFVPNEQHPTEFSI